MNIMKNRKIFNSLLIAVTALFILALLGAFAITQQQHDEVLKVDPGIALAYTPTDSPDGRNFSGGHTMNKSMWPTTLSTAGTHALNSDVSSYWAMNMSSGAGKDYKSTSTEIKCDQGTSTDQRYMYSWTTIPISSTMTNAIADGKVSMTFSMQWHHGTTGGERSTSVMIEWGTGDNGLDGFARKAGKGTVKDGAYDSWQSSSVTLSGAYSGVTRIRVGIANRKKGVGRHLDCFGCNMSLYISNNLSVAAHNKSKTYGDNDPGLTYYVSSGYLLGSWTGALSRDSGEDVGSYTIRQGSLGVSSGNNIQSFSNATLTINKRSITVTANNASSVYGDSDAALSFTNSNLGNGAPLQGTPARDSGKDVGKYAIRGGTVITNTTNTKNYNISFVNGEYSITKRTVTVIPTAGQWKYYGANDPTLTYTVNNIAYGETTLNGTLTRQAGDNVGSSYAIYQNDMKTENNHNYTVNFQSGVTFSINRRPITIKPDANQWKYYGNGEPTYTYSVSGGMGYAYGQTSLSGSLVRNNSDNENVGTYIIGQGSVNNDTNSNYAVTFDTTSVTMEIKRRPINVYANAVTITYGDDPVGLSYTHDSLGNGAALTGSLSRAANDNAGAHIIQQGTVTGGAGGTNSNYEITYHSAYYTIKKKPVTIHIEDAESDYKADLVTPLPWYRDPSTPLCYSQPDSYLDIQLTKAAGVTAGPYDITGGQGAGASPNYEVTFQGSNGNKGVYTIKPIYRNIQTDLIQGTYTYDGITRTINSGAYFADEDLESNPDDNTNFQYSNKNFRNVADSGDITISHPPTNNYLASTTTFTITINKRAVSVKIENASSIYGQNIADLTNNYTLNAPTSLGQGDTNAALGINLYTSASSTSNAGDYAITGTYSSSNYTVTFANGAYGDSGKYTIHKADTQYSIDASKLSGYYTYDGTNQQIQDVIIVTEGSTTIQYSNQYFKNVPNENGNPGEINVGYTIFATTNYNGATGTFKVTVQKATAPIDYSSVLKTYTYDGTTRYVSGASVNQVGDYKSPVVYENNQFRNAGTQTVKVYTVANINYNYFEDTFDITVNKATANITIDDITTEYGIEVAAEDFTCQVDSATPLQTGDSLSSLSIVLYRPVAGIDANTEANPYYAITNYSYNDANYTLTFTNGRYTINKKPIIVEIDDQTSAYKDQRKPLSCKVKTTTPLVYGQEIEVLDVKLSTAASSTAYAGDYAITATQGGLKSNNYTVTFSGSFSDGVSGTYTITKITREIVTDGVTQEYTYNGTERTINSGATLSVYEVDEYGVAIEDATVIAYTENTFTNVPESGEHWVTLTVEPTTNYEKVVKELKITVKKYAIVLNIEDKESEYKDNLEELTYNIASGYDLQGIDKDTSNYAALGVDLDTDASNTANVGTYRIYGVYESTNYSVTFEGGYNGDDTCGTYKINPVSITIDIEDKTSVYGEIGESIVGLTCDLNADSADLKSGDTLEGLGITLEKAGGATVRSVGDYAITATSYTNNNYSITFNNGTYFITAKAIKIDIDDKGSTFGEQLQDLTCKLYTGYQMAYNEDISVLDIKLTKEGSNNAGQHPITGALGSNASTNYDVTFINGWYFINRANRQIITEDMKQEYTYDGTTQTIDDARLSVYEVDENGIAIEDDNDLQYTNNEFENVPEDGRLLVRIDIGQTTNYNATYAEIEITILKAATSITGTKNEFTYTGSEQTIDLTTSGIDINHGNSVLTFSNNRFTNVPSTGIHTVTLKANASTNYLELNTTLDFLVHKYDVSITVANKSTVYGEEVEELTWALNGELLGNDTDDCLGIDLSTLAEKGSNVDVYDISVTYSSVNYTVAYNSATYTITQATATITKVGDWVFTYDGTDRAITSGAELNHSEGGVTLNYSQNTFRDVPENGILTVLVTAEATQNYTSANLSIIATINKAPMNVKILDKTSVYGKTIVDLEYQLLSPILGTDNEAALNINLSRESGIDVGAYEISATTGNNNYEFNVTGSLGTTAKYEITKAQTVIYDENVNKLYTYTGSEQVVNSGAETSQEGTYISDIQYTNNKFTDVPANGKHDVTIIVEGNHNYERAEKVVTITVNKAVTVIETEGILKDYTYTGEVQTVNTGAVNKQIGNHISEIQYLNNTFKNVPESGTKTITVKVPENTNYLEGIVDVVINIAKAESVIDISNVVRDYVYNRQTQEVTGATLNHKECDVTYTNNTFTSVPTSGKQTVTLSTVATENYKAATPVSFDINISKATQVIDTTNVKYRYFQNGATEDLPIVIDSGATVADTEQTVSYSNNVYHTEAEADEAELLIYAEETTNYYYTQTIVIIVTKNMPEVDLSFFENHVYVYDGTIQEITSGAILTKGAPGQQIYYQNNTFKTVAEGRALQLEVCVDRLGQYSGYKWIVTINVDKAPTNITIDNSALEFTYTGNSQTVECGSLNHNETSIVYTNNTFTTVAEGNALNVELYAAETDNYQEALVTTTITVHKAEAVIDITDVNRDFTYTGDVQTVTGATLNHGETELSYQNNTFKTVAEGNALNVVIKAIETYNYKAAETSFGILVKKATYDMSNITFNGLIADYNNEVYSLAIDGTLPNGVTVSYLNNDKVIAGDYVVVAEFNGDYANYNVIEDLSAHLVINKIVYDFSNLVYGNTTVTYNATPQKIIAENIPVGLDGIVVGSYYYGERTNIGESVLNVQFVSDSPNYIVNPADVEKTAKITIVPAEITVESDLRYYSDYLDVSFVNLTADHYTILGIQGDDAVDVDFSARFADTEAVGEATVLMTITGISNMNYILSADSYEVEIPAAIIYPIMIYIPEEVHFFDGEAKLPQISTTIAGRDVAKTTTIRDSEDNVINEAIDAGEYKITVTVSDEYAGTRTQTKTMRINKILPTIELIGDRVQTYGNFVPLGTRVSVAASDGSNLVTSIKYSFSNKVNPPAGTHTVTASFNGSKNYLPVRVNDTITINKKPIGVAVSSDNKFIYNGKERTLNFATTAIVYGDQNVVSLSYGDEGCAIKPGRYPIHVVVKNPNYEVNNIAGPTELIITKVPLFVSVNRQVAIENEIQPFTLSYRGFIDGEDASDLEQIPAVPDCKSLKAGTYIITPSEGVSDCYEFICEPLELTVYKRDLNTSASNVCEFTAKGVYDGETTIDVKPVDANKFFPATFTTANNITSAYRIDVSEAPVDSKEIKVVYNNVNIKKSLFTGAYYIDAEGHKTRINNSNITDGSINLTVNGDGGYVVVYTSYVWVYILVAAVVLLIAVFVIRALAAKRRCRRSRRSRPRWLA
jgi:hypothetical protein